MFEVLFFTRLLHYYDLRRTLSNSHNTVLHEEIEERPYFFNPVTASVTDGQTDTQEDRQTDRQTDRRTDGQTDIIKALSIENTLRLSSVSTRFSQIKSVIKNNKRM